MFWKSIGLKGKTKVITNGQLEERVISEGTNENSKLTHVTCVQRGKTRATKSRLLLILHLIGSEGSARYFNQSNSV